MLDEMTGELILPQAPELEIPFTTTEASEYQQAVEQGLVTPSVQIPAVIPSPPQKRRRLAIDRNIQVHADVIRHNVSSGGRDTLQDRSLEEHHLKSAKDLFSTPATEALTSQPLIDLWTRNAVTVPGEYDSSTSSLGSDEASPEALKSPGGTSLEVARSMETPSEKELARASTLPEGSGVFEHSDFTPDLQESGLRERDLSTNGDRGGLRTDLDMEPVAPRGRSSSLLTASLTGLLSPIQEPSDLDDFLEDIGELPTLLEQPEVTQPLEEQAVDTWRLVTRVMGDGEGPVVFSKVCPPQATTRKTAAKVFYHLLALHKNGVFELNQEEPFELKDIYISKGINF